MYSLMERLDEEQSIGINYIDNLVLDTLFVSVLRSHSAIDPMKLGSSFASSGTFFRGGNVDTCGRWDADSPCIRHLHATGETAIPHGWKHMFCHTSVQAVCHSMTAMFMAPWKPNVNQASGLFLRRCHCCGLELRLGPLHALVFVAFFLANSGLPGENLFGVLACFVCLLTLKADPSSVIQVSVSDILGSVTGSVPTSAQCQHRPLDAAELVSVIPGDIVRTWTPELQLGWRAIGDLLRHRVQREGNPEALAPGGWDGYRDNHVSDEPGTWQSDDDQFSDRICRHAIHFDFDTEDLVDCGDRRLATIWAAIQAELLNYRRMEENDSWLSPRFRVQDVVEGLESDDDRTIRRLVEIFGEGTFQPFSQCGLFHLATDAGCVTREEACRFHFANLENWKRTTFIEARFPLY